MPSRQFHKGQDIYHPQIPACAGSRSYISGMRCDIYHLQIPAVAGTCKCFLLSKCGIYCVNTCYCRLVTVYMIGGWYAPPDNPCCCRLKICRILKNKVYITLKYLLLQAERDFSLYLWLVYAAIKYLLMQAVEELNKRQHGYIPPTNTCCCRHPLTAWQNPPGYIPP